MNRAAGEASVRDAVPDEDQVLAEGIDRIVFEVHPHPVPKTWYGFPSYSTADGKFVGFFKADSKFTTRYATLGFEEPAQPDDGELWLTSFTLVALTPETEKTNAKHICKAAGWLVEYLNRQPCDCRGLDPYSARTLPNKLSLVA